MKLLTGWINRQLFIALVKDTFVKSDSDDFSCFKGTLIKDKYSLKLFHSAFITLPHCFAPLLILTAFEDLGCHI